MVQALRGRPGGGFLAERVVQDLHDGIKRYPVLPRETQLLLIRRYQAGDTEAGRRLCAHSLGAVAQVAMKYVGQGLDYAELVSEGSVGVMSAMGRFDHKRGNGFLTYAVWWIRQAIRNALDTKARLVRRSAERTLTVLRAKRKGFEMRQAVGGTYFPAFKEKPASRAEARAENLLQTDVPPQSLHMEVEDGITAIDLLADENAESPDAGVLAQFTRLQCRDLLGSLRGQERRALFLYFGLDGIEGRTLADVGEIMGVCRERVRQVMQRGIQRLRESTTE